MTISNSFFNEYFAYIGESESPPIYHRWAIISAIGAMLGRQVYIPFGHFTIYPNQYILLMGTAGARKSGAIDIAKNLLKDSGYKRFAPARTSKECLLVEMKSAILDEIGEADLELLVFDAPSEIYVCKGEFVDFIGINDMGFMNLLTDLWDNLPDYDNPKITRKSVKVEKPTISILGGATPHGIAISIPADALEMGFTSRMLFVFSEPSGVKLTFPPKPCQALRQKLLEKLQRIKANMVGEVVFTAEARAILDRMYKEFQPIEDARFSKYSARRFTHLLKVTLILAVLDERFEIDVADCIEANTILNAAEMRMPKALGEFGKSKYSNVSNMVVEYLNHAVKPITLNELWKLVAKDLSKIAELGDIMKNLQHSEKVQIVTIKDKQGYMAKHAESKKWNSSLIDESYLTPEERSL